MNFLGRPSRSADRTLWTRAMASQHPAPDLSLNQCGSFVSRTIDAPLPLVWSLVRCFDNPQAYKLFVKSCVMVTGTRGVGSIRDVTIMSGLPAEQSRERLEELDEDTHVMIFSIIGGDHRLRNYRSTVSLHQDENEEEEDCGSRKTKVIESYVVDIPSGSSREDTVYFTETIIGCNLRSLASVAERMASLNI
ncbi:hypothetical protein MLD38_027576 [Melastoma candidum]|uniref:Uncharacterized protein n=1 Tax=Melastoma candidum TaxID=119954 RepID=A0ACB9P3R2_9MYRT|nr:hypothetical protein MLD38_027576 [Melastoma candidum]